MRRIVLPGGLFALIFVVFLWGAVLYPHSGELPSAASLEAKTMEKYVEGSWYNLFVYGWGRTTWASISTPRSPGASSTAFSPACPRRGSPSWPEASWGWARGIWGAGRI